MAKTWLQVRVDLVGGGGLFCDPSPGRIFIVGPRHTFEQLAEAIDVAFARWDRSHLHVFELADGRGIGFPEDSWLDHATLKVAREVEPGAEFVYVFDFGDNWRHHCTVLPDRIDPVEEYGEAPTAPAAILGWGAIPDQYGRRSYDDEGE